MNKRLCAKYDLETAIKAHKQILRQCGTLDVDIAGLLTIGQVLKEAIGDEKFEELLK